MTGAVLPKGTDSVVMVEDSRKKNGYVEILKSVAKGSNVCFKGEDIKKGQKIFQKGRTISISDMALLATVGKPLVRIVKKPEVALLNTGGEIVPLGRKLNKGKIYNSNGPQLLTLLKLDGITPHFLGIAKDTPYDLLKAIKKGLKSNVFLISGGVSMGDYDLVPKILEKLGVKKIFHKVNIKPGKPLFFGVAKGTIVFGIPGNPVSNFLAYNLFIRPALYKLMGAHKGEPLFKQGIVMKAFSHKSDRTHFVLVKIFKKGDGYCLYPIASHGSADILALSKADGFMIVEANVAIVKATSRVKFFTWRA